MIRLSFDEYVFELVKVVASRSTCLRRITGAVLVRDKSIIATGYNGSPRNAPNCVDIGFCARAESPPGEENEKCRGFGCHGEANSLVQAAREGVAVKGCTLYTLYSPCKSCCHLLVNAGIAEVKYIYEYEGFPQGPGYLVTLGIKVEKKGG